MVATKAVNKFMQHTTSMKYNFEFKRLYHKGNSITAGFLVLYYRKRNQPENRLGITVSRKIGNAVTRNRIRRLIRESYRLKEPSIAKGYDFVFVARARAVHCSFEQINRDMSFLLKKSGLWLGQRTP